MIVMSAWQARLRTLAAQQAQEETGKLQGREKFLSDLANIYQQIYDLAGLGQSQLVIQVVSPDSKTVFRQNFTAEYWRSCELEFAESKHGYNCYVEFGLNENDDTRIFISW